MDKEKSMRELEARILQMKKEQEQEAAAPSKKKQKLLSVIYSFLILGIFVCAAGSLHFTISRYKEKMTEAEHAQLDGMTEAAQMQNEENREESSILDEKGNETETGIEEAEPEEVWEASEATFLLAIDDFQQGQYKAAARKLEVLREDRWDGYAVWQYLADSYYQLGDYDLAALRIAEYLQDYYGLADVQEENVLYQRLKEWKPLLSASAGEEIRPVLEEAASSAAAYQEIYGICSGSIEGLIQHAYQIADSLRIKGADSFRFLCAFFFTANWKGIGEELPAMLEPILYDTESLTGRMMTFSQRAALVNSAYLGQCELEGDIQLELAKHEADFETCGKEITDLDPVTKSDIDGVCMLEDLKKEAEEELSQFEFIRRSLEYTLEDPTIQNGSHQYVMESFINYAYRIDSRTMWDPYRKKATGIIMTYDEEGYPEAKGFTLNEELTDDVSFLNRSYQNATNSGMELDIRNAHRDTDATIVLEMQLQDLDHTNTVLPWTELHFENNRCLVEEENWGAEIFLGSQGVAIYNLYLFAPITSTGRADGLYR